MEIKDKNKKTNERRRTYTEMHGEAQSCTEKELGLIIHLCEPL